jgi:GT2 family glycosyltransferase
MAHVSPVGPVELIELELAQRLPSLAPELGLQGTEVLVRLHGRPLGIVEIGTLAAGMGAEELASRIWAELGDAITTHLEADGLAVPLDVIAGLPAPDDACCIAERRAFLERAPFVTVVVATRDRPAHLAACLESILSLEYPSFEVLVVDNAPTTDSTAELVRKRFAGRGVWYVREDRPGLAAAHNRGIAEAGGSVIAFTDDDVLVDGLWLLELARAFEAAESVGCVTGLILPAELETSAQLVLERYSRLGKGFTRRLYDTGPNRPRNSLFPYAAGLYGSGANMAFSKEALRDIGGFDPATGTGTLARGGDDLAAFFEIVAAGYTLVYEPAALVRHRHRSNADLERQLFDYGAGLTAYLTKVVLDRPGRLFDIARRVPGGLAHGLAPGSERNACWHGSVPRELVRAERRGMLYGPVGYMRSRWSRV